MPVPDFQSLMLPALKAFAGGGEPPLSQVRERIAAAECLSAEDIREMLPSGRQTVFVNRVSWAVIYMERAGLLERVRRGMRSREAFARKTQPGIVALTAIDQLPIGLCPWDV